MWLTKSIIPQLTQLLFKHLWLSLDHRNVQLLREPPCTTLGDTLLTNVSNMGTHSGRNVTSVLVITESAVSNITIDERGWVAWGGHRVSIVFFHPRGNEWYTLTKGNLNRNYTNDTRSWTHFKRSNTYTLFQITLIYWKTMILLSVKYHVWYI